jgi:hypothetical protein
MVRAARAMRVATQLNLSGLLLRRLTARMARYASRIVMSI